MSNKPDKTAEQKHKGRRFVGDPEFTKRLALSDLRLSFVAHCAACKSQIEKETAKRIKGRLKAVGLLGGICDMPDCDLSSCKRWQEFWKEIIGE